MTERFKFAPAAMIAAALCALPLASPAAAGEGDDIVVSSRAAMEQWQAETTASINRALLRDPASRRVPTNNAIVEVAFTLGADGQADNIRIVGGEGNWAARHAAKYAVRSLDRLGEVPVRNARGQKFVANIIFADNKETHKKLSARLENTREQRLAEAGEDTIVLGG